MLPHTQYIKQMAVTQQNVLRKASCILTECAHTLTIISSRAMCGTSVRLVILATKTTLYTCGSSGFSRVSQAASPKRNHPALRTIPLRWTESGF